MMRTALIVLLTSVVGLACTTTTEPDPEMVEAVQAAEPLSQPPAEPDPAAVTVADPRSRPTTLQLPKTASSLPLVGLSGLAALGAGGALRIRRLRR